MYKDKTTQEILSLSDLTRRFPLTSFPYNGPDDAWLESNNLERYTSPTPVPTTDQIAQQIKSNVNALWQAANDYQEGFISGAAIGLLTIGVIKNLPKSLAIMTWIQNVWAEYYTQKPLVTAEYVHFDFSIVGPMPYNVPELQTEVLGS